ncbi:MAG: hypothetical protein WDZ76_04170 [Pseudohongiellaceae bacterium]
MNDSHLRGRILITTTLTFAMLAAASVAAQESDSWQVPRTADGQPDLQGVWANNTLTPVERPAVFGDQEILTDEDIRFLEQRIAEITAEGGDALFGGGVLEAAFSGEIQSYDPSTGNYDQSWMAQRSVHRRTSQIIDPPTGKYPPRTEEAIAVANERRAYRQEHPADSWEDRPLSERCISYGAPYLGSGYNSYWQIVQSENYVTIIQEMIHDVRIIPLDGRPHIPDNVKLWHGDSRGYWDGDTLVIETRNYAEESDYGPDTAAKINVERLTRLGPDALQYEITSHDPGTFSAPYTRQIIFDHSPDPIYEYACHEGNYGMMYILSGHRAEERRAAEATD